ncbi:tryptophan--tRNA ligase [Algimonas arctica]|uniref:Tryptophan--tRNA ligase n=1 Tax=Algimonas arctica TaxID=1479486 RepID=A0A8J3CQU4_9PROT|nr:tryptophan--tRNA ligase [Algimonas arctica]GHA87970.1 tryptophan--tRNA ligase [Algimonas arctica]
MSTNDNSTKNYQGPDRVFSGVQPTGSLHLGNYLGALKKFAALQHEHECLFCIVDLHALTMPQEHGKLAGQTRHIAAAFLAAGVQPDKALVYAQSAIPAHTELAWYFNCVARMGWVQRMTQFKDKSGKNAEAASVGLFTYPALMAADILAYKATHVPVGDDQKQHLELARDIAAKFNHDFGEPAGEPNFFPLPEPLIDGPGARVMSLRDGTKKMSKSDPSDASRINLTDDPDTIAKKIRKAKTDTGSVPGSVEELAGRPEIANLVGIYSALSDTTDAEVLAQHAGSQFGPFKNALADVTVEAMRPVSDLMRRYLADPDELDRIMSRSADAARAISEPVMVDVRRIIGIHGSAA